MVLAQTAETLLRIQSAAQAARRQLVNEIPVPGASQLIAEIERLETLMAQSIARAVGATPMAMGGMVTSPTFALLGEAGPEMVIPMKKKKRRVSKYQREFGKQYRKLDEKNRLRNGSLRSGMTRSKLMRSAHKATRKSLGMK